MKKQHKSGETVLKQQAGGVMVITSAVYENAKKQFEYFTTMVHYKEEELRGYGETKRSIKFYSQLRDSFKRTIEKYEKDCIN